MIPFTYFTCWLSSHHLNYLISEILGQRNTKFEVLVVFVYRKHQKLSNFSVKVCFRQPSNFKCMVTISMSCLRPVKTCFSVTCPHLDENDRKLLTTNYILVHYDHVPQFKFTVVLDIEGPLTPVCACTCVVF